MPNGLADAELADEIFEYLEKNGPYEQSSSWFRVQYDWLSTYPDENYSTGEATTYNYHFKNISQEVFEIVYDKLQSGNLI